MPIKLLPARLANQIAAGEVVERPASVVKELVENSLDAGASRIELDIEKGGHKRIKLRDNGCGIIKDELELALSRHATSKIATLDDLEQILSLGFRGEALASISSVSRLSLISKPADQEQAWEARCEGRDMAVQLQPAAHPDGTTIDVADIFYNTPARRKFLRTEKTEYQHIEEVIKRIALSRPDVTFILRHNGKVIKRFAAVNGELAARVAQVCGQSFIQQAIHAQCDYDGIRFEAWLGDQRQMRSSNDCQYSFVNGRGMRDKLILHAMRQAYDSVLGLPEQPAFVVYLQVNPKEVDVNVHPAKHEVRFQQSRLVHDFICKAVCDALDENLSFDESLQPKHQTAETGHDYIRPLTHSESPVTTTEFSPSAYSEGTAKPGGQRPGTSGQYQAGSAKVTHDYSRHYQQLMTPTDIPANPVSGPGDFITLSDMARLYTRASECTLLTGEALLAGWLKATLVKSTVAQPLLMPVAVSSKLADTSVHFLNDSDFEVSTVGGKTRLLKVPGALRHLPWAGIFGELVATGPQDAEQLSQTMAILLVQAQWQSAASWQWFDELAISEQNDILNERGATVSQHALMQWIQQVNNND